MAAHIEYAVEDMNWVSRGLKKLYGCNSTVFHVGIRMNPVSEVKDVKGSLINMGKHI